MSGVAQLVKMGAKGVDALVDALRAGKKAAPQDEALALAQQRAALPIEQGGLGLPPTNTAMDRAKAMGFDTPAFHGTARDFDQFSIAKSVDKEGRKMGLGWGKDKMYFADTGEAASGAASGAEYFGRGTQQNVIPSLLNIRKPIHSDEYIGMVDNFINQGLTRDKAILKVDKSLQKQGIDAINSDVGGMAVFNPDQIRSRFAAFDPWRKTAAVAATMGVAAPNLLAEELRKK
jgi:hypothetical protein